MINVLTKAFDVYMRTPFEDFTSKYILAVGLFQLIDNFKEKDLETLKEIETFTNDKIKVSIYKLDRVVNPTKGNFEITERKFSFIREVIDGNRTIELTESQIQQHLCKAIRIVHEIVLRNMKDYKLEQSMNPSSENDEEDKVFMDMFKS